MYTGVPIMAVRDLPASACYFTVYEGLFHWLLDQPYTDRTGIIASVLAGGTAGVLSWMIIMPFDVIKNNIQADFRGTKYKGVIDCTRKMYRAGGVRSFFTGIGVNSVRAFPVNAVTFLFYNQTMRLLNGESTGEKVSETSV